MVCEQEINRKLVFVSELNIDLSWYGEQCVLVEIQDNIIQLMVEDGSKVYTILRGYDFQNEGRYWIHVESDIILEIFEGDVSEDDMIKMVLEPNRVLYIRRSEGIERQILFDETREYVSC